MARSGHIVNSSPGHELGELAEPRLCDIEVHEEPNKIGRGKKEGGVLFHRLHFLSTNKGGVDATTPLAPLVSPGGGLGPSCCATCASASGDFAPWQSRRTLTRFSTSLQNNTCGRSKDASTEVCPTGIVASDHRARAKGDEATHSPGSWETKGSRKLLAPLKRTSVMLSSRIMSGGKGITSATQGKRVYGVGLAVGTKKRTKGWTPNP